MRYKVCELLENTQIDSFAELFFKEQSQNEYDGDNSYQNCTNMFSINEHGQLSICCKNNILYLENWKNKKVTRLTHQMNTRITFVNADFDKDFVISGDHEAYFMIQRISTGRILFRINHIIYNFNSLICSSIYNQTIYVGNNFKEIATVDLKTFIHNKKITFIYDGASITSLNVVTISNQNYLMVTGKSKIN